MLKMLMDPTRSSYREQLVEYAFLTELLQDGWFRRGQKIDVLHSEVDGSGYDLVAQCQGVTRHLQLKSSVVGGKTARQKAHIDLADQASGAVVWVVLHPEDSRLRMTFLVFGGEAGKPIADLTAFPVAKHTKGNAEGIKAERKNHRVLPKAKFKKKATIVELSD
ncbi:MAG: hypothetical protein Q8L48_25605 [Archangium sp.]|nr:hypothetical protein [Archangium sp.]